jgi:hypothetical protein
MTSDERVFVALPGPVVLFFETHGAALADLPSLTDEDLDAAQAWSVAGEVLVLERGRDQSLEVVASGELDLDGLREALAELAADDPTEVDPATVAAQLQP